LENKPLVTIVTVCYNSEKTIKDTIESVLNQTYTNIEYILVDGASKDSTVDIIKSYEEKFKEKGIIYKWISEPDKGIYDAMNKGIDMATGELIGIINSDDWYEVDAVENVLKVFFENSEVGIIHGNINRFTFDREFIAKRKPFKKDLNYKKMWKGMILNHPTCFVKQEIYERLGKFDTSFKITADYDFLLRCLKNNVNFKYIDTILANMREGGISDKYIKLSKEEANKALLKNGKNRIMLIISNIEKQIKTLVKRGFR
jgi:glycosyltransferase involved in cell wall biosynthesis